MTKIATSERKLSVTWSKKLLSEFLELASETAIDACDALLLAPHYVAANYLARRTPPTGLLGVALPRMIAQEEPHDPIVERRERIDALLSRVRNHEGYRLLNTTNGFQRIMRVRHELADHNAKFAGPLGEIRLAREIALAVGGYSPNAKLKRATRDRKRKVCKAAQALDCLLMPGAEPDSWHDARELRRLLLSLQAQLAADLAEVILTGKRARRADKTEAQRVRLVWFATMLIIYFDEAPAAILKEVATMLEYEADDRTIFRYIESAKAQWAKIRAKAAVTKQ